MVEWSAETVYEISRWSEVFETAESRRHRQLQWIAHPVSFNSTGFQDLLDRFEPMMAAALYGCWSALVKIAATAPRRGVLAGQKGEPYSTARMARLSGFDAALFDTLVRWCCEIGWLVPAQAITGLPDITRQDITRPDRTGPDRTEPEAQTPGRAGPAEVQKDCSGESQGQEIQEQSAAESTSRRQRLRGRSFSNLLRHEAVADLCHAPVDPIRGKLSGGCFKPLTRSTIAREAEGYWVRWYREQLGSDNPVLTHGTAAEAAILLASVYAVRAVPDSAVRKSRVGLWITWVSGQDGSQISDEQLTRAAEIVRAARAKAREKAGAA